MKITTADPVILWTGAGVAGILAVAFLVVMSLNRLGKLHETTAAELYKRIGTWALIAPAVLVPLLLGSVAFKIAGGILGLFCFREFSRATGLFRDRPISFTVYGAIAVLTAAGVSGITGLWIGTSAVMPLVIAAAGLCLDRPHGYIQRVALGVLGFALFGTCLGHLGLIADRLYGDRILVWLFLCVGLNDVAAYMSGKLWGKRKLCPNTSPNKTLAGAVGAIVFTSLLSALAGNAMSLPIQSTLLLALAGALLSGCAQVGDLIVSSIKRDLRIKDMSSALPGHGGLLDRFDSLVPAAPAAFYLLAAVGWTASPPVYEFLIVF